MDKQVFRKVSMERLSSPEQLDSLMKVTSPKGWLALIAIGLLLTSALIWALSGSISTKIHGQGVLIKPGGIHQVFATSTGQITDIRAVVDDLMNKGDIVARIYQPEMLEQIKAMKNEIAALNTSIQNEESLAERRVLENRLDDMKEDLSSLLTEYELASRVVSPYTGRVLEVHVKKGDRISSGVSTLTMEITGANLKELEAIMYIPAGEGNKVLPGMEVQISPASINKEEYGFMIGRVISISEFPTTDQGMMNTLGNEALVRQLSGMGVVLEVRIDLTPDMSTFSGYKWSSKQGPPVEINSGTLAVGSITLKKEKPITSVIPQIK